MPATSASTVGRVSLLINLESHEFDFGEFTAMVFSFLYVCPNLIANGMFSLVRTSCYSLSRLVLRLVLRLGYTNSASHRRFYTNIRLY
jgi:hypothetical protein